MKRWRWPIAATDHHSVAHASAGVARGAINVVPLLSARHHSRIHRKRKYGRVGAVDPPGVEQRVLMQVLARDGADNGGAGRTAISEEGRFAEWDVLRLIVHVL